MFLKICLFLVLAVTSVFGEAIFQPQKPGLFIVDDFEDADLSQFPRWWGFDNIDLTVEPNNLNEFSHLGKRSLQLTGLQKNWYVGGCGTYFGIDVSDYNAIKLLVRGYGKKSGVLIVELFDDDNNNFEIEPHPDADDETLADDKFIHTLKVDWNGWKVVIIPFNNFVDGNLGIGDDLWNPYQTDSSGGLLQLQLVLLAGDKNVKPRVRIDEIKIYNQGPMPIKKVSDDSDSDLEDDDFF